MIEINRVSLDDLGLGENMQISISSLPHNYRRPNYEQTNACINFAIRLLQSDTPRQVVVIGLLGKEVEGVIFENPVGDKVFVSDSFFGLLGKNGKFSDFVPFTYFVNR